MDYSSTVAGFKQNDRAAYDPNQQGNSGLKAYELAKELGIDSISLLDRLKGEIRSRTT